MSAKESNIDRYGFTISMLHPRFWGTWLGMLIFFLVTLLPHSLVDRIGERIGEYAARKNRKRFNIVKVNMGLCFPDKSEAEVERMVIEHFRSQFRSLLHYYILWWRPGFIVRQRFITRGFEQIAEHQGRGKNVIVLLTHNVGLDFAVAAISMEHPSSGPFKSLRNAVVERKIATGRLRFGKKFGSRLFTRDDGLRPLIKETRSGKVLIYLGDEDLGIENAVFSPFFGVQKATIAVLGRLTKACNAVVLPCVSCYDPVSRRYTIEMMEPVEGLTGKDDDTDALLMNQAIEKAIRRCPLQYLWTLRYFQTRPEGEPSVYG